MLVERALLAGVCEGFEVVDVVDADLVPVDDEDGEELGFEAELVAATKDGGDDEELGVDDDEVVLAAWIAASAAGLNVPVMPLIVNMAENASPKNWLSVGDGTEVDVNRMK